MIRITLSAETVERIEKVAEHFKDLDPEKVRAILTEVEQRKEQYWQNMHNNLMADYNRNVSLTFPRYPISHPFKRGGWRLSGYD